MHLCAQFVQPSGERPIAALALGSRERSCVNGGVNDGARRGDALADACDDVRSSSAGCPYSRLYWGACERLGV